MIYDNILLASTLSLLTAPGMAAASVAQYSSRTQWEIAISYNYATVDFVGFPDMTYITDQYAHMGVTFESVPPFVFQSPEFLNDGYGVRASSASSTMSITFSFSQPMTSVAAEYPGTIAFRLYSGESLLYTSSDSGSSQFLGLVSTAAFDRVEVFRHSGNLPYIDDLFFGPPIPVPRAMALLGVAALAGLRRRRHQ